MVRRTLIRTPNRQRRMPKVVVLFPAHSAELARLADVVAAGARTVRFAEVDVRRVGDAAPDAAEATRRRALEQPDELAQYDGIIVGVDSDGTDSLAALFGRAQGGLADRIGAAFTDSASADRRTKIWQALSTMAERGMILVPAPSERTDEDETMLHRLGARVAEVVGWVTHARSHQHHHHH